MQRPSRRPGERALAWLVTGSAGHLWSAAADLALFGLRYLLARLTRRGPSG
jgi:hypothetical protein